MLSIKNYEKYMERNLIMSQNSNIVGKKTKKETIGVYLYVFYLLFCNSSVFFGVKFGTAISIIAFIVSIIIIFLYPKINYENLKVFLLSSSVFLVVNLLNLESGVNWISVFIFIMQILTLSIIQTHVNIDVIAECIIKFMVVICVISLITFAVGEVGLPIFDNFIIRERIHNSRYTYIYTFWHTFGWDRYFNRNAGPYWEPGMFACYIAISMCLLVFKKDICFKKSTRFVYFGIYFITILSTMSTAGYITLIVFFLFFILKVPGRTFKQILYKCALFLLLAFIVTLLARSDVVQDKLFTENSSMLKRTANITGGLQLIKESPLLGLGFRSDRSRKLEVLFEAGDAANGLIQGCYRLGILMFSLFLYYYYRGLRKIMKYKESISVFVLFLLLMFCEPIQINLIFLILLFVRFDRAQKEI